MSSTARGGAGTRLVEALGSFALRRRRVVLVGGVLFALLAAGISGNVVERLSSAGFDDPGSESVRTGDTLERRFGVRVPNFVLLVKSKRSIDDPEVAGTGAALAGRLAREPGVDRVESYWTSGPSARRRLRSRDRRAALIQAQLRGDDDAVSALAKKLAPAYEGRWGKAEVGLTGLGPLVAQTEEQVKQDLMKAELIALPLTLLALFFVFRGALAAALPLAIGVLSIAGTMLALRLLSEVTEVSVFAVNLATALGLGLAIDYSLFVVARYRDELAAGLPPPGAILATMRTAGRTILFSAVTVAISLAGLLVFPMYYLRSFAYAGVAVVVIAAIGALVLLPALLAVLGPRLEARRTRRARSPEEGFWHRFATLVMRRPLPVATLAVALLLVLGTPFLHASLAFSDDRNLPESAAARQVSDDIRRDFAVREGGTLFVLSERALRSEIAGYAQRLSRVPGVVAVSSASGSFEDGRRALPAPRGPDRRRFLRGRSTWLAVDSRIEPYSIAGERLARRVEAIRAPFPVSVTGIQARIADTKATMADRLPFALAVIVLTTFIALLAMTGSILAPLKALLLNALSLTAVFGALVFIFQDGHLAWLVGDFTVTDTLNVLNPPLMFCIAFGLSMDYEVFMLSRIKEEYDRTGDNASSVARGLQQTGPIITAAAAVMTIVFLAFASSGVTNVKVIGVGLAIAVVVDATIVRAALVPAFMRLAGRFNWWAPAPLRRLHTRLGLAEGS